LAAHFNRDVTVPKPFKGLTLLDVGCGGGLFSEPMARLGFRVTGIDAGRRNVEVARIHAAKMGLDIDYRCQAPEDLAAEGRRFNVVLILEVVEHVADLSAFLPAAAALVAPGGALVAATINRTLKALALAKVGAEYILHWLPRGTHEWSKFVRPSELAAGLRAGGLQISELAGMSYNVLTDSWSVSRDLDVNYMIFATGP
jgi:2-polyprenyl-6-hydroxyphenyl methylase/3-demethylubiquinone-9 3-methyltransferase